MTEFSLEELMNEMHPISHIPILPSNDDVMSLSKRLDHLEVDINTQNLELKIEKMKRRKLRKSVKHLKNEILIMKQTQPNLERIMMY